MHSFSSEFSSSRSGSTTSFETIILTLSHERVRKIVAAIKKALLWPKRVLPFGGKSIDSWSLCRYSTVLFLLASPTSFPSLSFLDGRSNLQSTTGSSSSSRPAAAQMAKFAYLRLLRSRNVCSREASFSAVSSYMFARSRIVGRTFLSFRRTSF